MKTLQQWQKCYKNKNNIIINASATDGSDSPQEFPIGMCFRYINCQGVDTQIGNHDKLVFCGIR